MVGGECIGYLDCLKPDVMRQLLNLIRYSLSDAPYRRSGNYRWDCWTVVFLPTITPFRSCLIYRDDRGWSGFSKGMMLLTEMCGTVPRMKTMGQIWRPEMSVGNDLKRLHSLLDVRWLISEHLVKNQQKIPPTSTNLPSSFRRCLIHII